MCGGRGISLLELGKILFFKDCWMGFKEEGEKKCCPEVEIKGVGGIFAVALWEVGGVLTLCGNPPCM